MPPIFRKKSGEYPSRSNWSVSSGQHQGKPLYLRRNDSAVQLISDPRYRFRVGVAVPLQHLGEDGLPGPEELEILGKIEDGLAGELESGLLSLQVLSITTGGMREFVFYARDPQQVKEVLLKLQAGFPPYQIQFYISQDKNWELFKHYL